MEGWMRDASRVAGGLLFLLLFTTNTQAGGRPDPLTTTASRYVTADGVRVHYKSLGEGTTAVALVHCWCGDLRFWKEQVPAFHGRARLILIDLPGHGHSDKPDTDYPMERFARAVVAVLKDAGVESAVLVGHSMGVPVVRQVYRLSPATVRGLVAVDGTLRRPTQKPAQLQGMLHHFSGPGYHGRIDQAVAGMAGSTASPQVRRWLRDVSPSAPQHAAVSAMRGMNDPAIWNDDAITVPLQVIVARSPSWAGDYEAYVRKLAPQVEYHVMDGVGHYLMLEKPKEFNALLTGFLQRREALRP
jgi:pimeloyl-ACP methyl ester carboxylesterase